ncbi:RsmB/NOP family class I SAM-dependent RNA methyltransferase [Streptococcus moroccensis]|uniref:NOL1/NOP2/sun family putative RNA methylase n=1 Tax=Streptococcus moroccensis TaxID=1451356 RepID=A0ABT9YR49_9STRE|nr:RsmB/NOP family class I SAM-dependent RNA methyltransferase [Streptococcus moroccensis]MDQ0222466.1 NOL1/NOP2/sun family putative RNA methylase [Streptococcus moroccensis]
MQLPESFRLRYEKWLGTEEAQAFFQTFQQPAVTGFRTNPLKENQRSFDAPIPSMPWSYYGKVSGKSLEHVTGLVYSQEPAAQVVGQIAQPEPGMKVLDLCAAPGGKSTHLLSYLNNQGILVSNEINKKRSKILVENIERFGARNVIVTNESAERLAKVFKAYFDLIVLDAPCSGEGMFRKDPDAINYWSEDYPASCARLQRKIIQDAMIMLKPGGRLVYSTCTWAPEENEDIVNWVLEEFPDFNLIPVAKINGMVEGLGQPETARMYPHHFKGEGQFVAHFQDKKQGISDKPVKSGKSNLTKDQLHYWREFESKHLNVKLEGILQTFGDELYLVPQGLPDLSKMRLARNGLHLGTYKTKRFEPSFALGVALKPKEVMQSLTLCDEEAERYIRGEALALNSSLPNGWYQVLVAGNGLGFAKWVNGTLKNYYPKGLRMK